MGDRDTLTTLGATGENGCPPGSAAERGQTLTLFLLIFVTLTLIGIVAVIMGQTLVRRQHAQMVADAAAFAGASMQAQGMNNIARLNSTALTIQQEIHVSLDLPYVDNEATSWAFVAAGFAGPEAGAALRAVTDWAGDAIRKYQSTFDIINLATDLVNKWYSAANPIGGPNKAAKDVVDANFGSGSTKLFKGEQPKSKGRVVVADLGVTGLTEILHLVKLTDPEEYQVQGWYYMPQPDVAADCAEACETIIGCVVLAALIDGYLGSDIYSESEALWNPAKFKFGKFYDNPSGRDVRFTYYLQIKNTPAVLGHSFFADIPPITVVATGKPYDGYLGKKFSNYVFWTSQSSSKIREEYKAKLVRVKAVPPWGGLEEIPVWTGESGDFTRWLTVTH